MSNKPSVVGINQAFLKSIANEARALDAEIVSDRRMLHTQPELGWKEVKTTEFIVKRLVTFGYKVKSGREFLGDVERLGERKSDYLPTGCVADLEGSEEGPTSALRVDIDALPIIEGGHRHRPENEGFASHKKGVMHACGHDGHIAIGLAVAAVVARHRSELKGRFRLIFQPAEEGTRGSRPVVNAGWLDCVDVFLAFHIGLGVPSCSLALGTKGFLATKKFRVRFTGEPSHAGKEPQNGRNALLGACQAVLGLHTLAQSSEPGVRLNVGTLQSGSALNVVPDSAEFGFEVRAIQYRTVEQLAEDAARLIGGCASAFGLGHEIKLIGEADSWENPDDVKDWSLKVAQASRVFENYLMDFEFSASEDATVMANHVATRGGKAGYFVLGSDLASMHHTPTFDFDENVLPEGTAFLAGLVIDSLTPDEGK